MEKIRRIVVCLGLALGAACGGGDNNGDPNAAPTAAFTASATTVAAGGTLTFDASASSDPDGDTLVYSWSFGSSGRGSVARLAHIFSTVGSQTVKLTVSDGRGGKHEVTQTIAVTAGPTPVGSAATTVRVITPALQPVSGATVSLVGGASATTDAQGNAALTIGTGIRQVVRVEAAGFARRTHVANLAGAASGGYLELVLQPLGTAQSLADASAGGSIQDATGAKVTVKGRSLVGAAGTPITGDVDVYVSPVDVTTNPRSFPGLFSGRDAEGVSSAIASYGTVDFNFMKDGEKLDLAPGETATIEVPVFPTFDLDGNPVGLGKVIPLWSLDEESGEWIREGEGSVVASSTSPTGFVQRATVGHFSWWNCDDLLGSVVPLDANCCYDPNNDGVCDGGLVSCFLVGRTCSDDTCDQNGSYQAPLYGPSQSLSDGMTATLDLPLAATVAIEAYGPNGLTRGRFVAPKNTTRPDSTTILLTPFTTPPPTDEPITLPFDFTGSIEATPTVYQVELTDEQNLWVNVQRGGGSSLSGRVRLLSPSSEELENATFGTTVANFTHAIDSSGLYTIEVSGLTSGATGTYRIEVRDIGDAMAVQSMTPAVGATIDLPLSQVSVTFTRPVKANTVTQTSFRVFGPGSQILPLGGAAGITVDGQTVTFQISVPSNYVGSGLTYRVVLDATITDTLGEHLLPFEGTFRTADALLGFARAMPTLNSAAAISSDGTAIVVGQDNQQIYFVRYVPGSGGWTLPDLIPPAGANVHNPRIAMADGGIAMVTYIMTLPGSVHSVYANVYSPSTGWGPPMAVPMEAGTEPDGSDRGGALALDNQGRALRVYLGGNGYAYSWYQPGVGWSAAADMDGGQTYTNQQRAVGVLNANGLGGFAFKGTSGLVVRRFDSATGVLGPVLTYGNSNTDYREMHVDAAGNLYTMRVDASGNVYVARLPYDTVNEADHEVLVSGSIDCTPNIAVTPSGKVAFSYCEAGPDAYVKHWDGDPAHAWGAGILMDDANVSQRSRIAAAGEGFVLVHGDADLTPSYRTYTGGVWAVSSTPLPDIGLGTSDGLQLEDVLLASPHGETFLVRSVGVLGRLR